MELNSVNKHKLIEDRKTFKWIQMVHTDSEELGMFKNYSSPISKG